jgi:Kef-type K+ transport system membrane component KefB
MTMTDHDAIVFSLQLALMLAVGLVAALVMMRLRLPVILGELMGGVIIGPTVLGALAPGWFDWLFPAGGGSSVARNAVTQLGMLFFLLVAGLEVDYAAIVRRGASIVWTSLCGVALPFVAGILLVFALPGLWGSQAQAEPVLFALFLGTALSISALPVIARILMDMNLLKTELGTVVMAAATIDDLIGWTLFALILGEFLPGGSPAGSPWITLLLAAGLWILALTIGRKIARRAMQWMPDHMPWPGSFLMVTAIAVLAVGALAEAIGIHAFLGAFLVGIALVDNAGASNAARDAVRQFVTYFFAPLYFVSVGLQANFIVNFDLPLVLVVVVVACASKIVGASVGARLGGLSPRKALAVGFGMNARGAMGMILASLALSYGLIDQRVFVALIIMALVTSLLSGPVMQRLLAGEPRPALIGEGRTVTTS